MRVKIEFIDNESLTVEEVVAQAQHNYGRLVKVETAPITSIAYDHIYHGLQQLITHQQVSLIHDKSGNYQTDLKRLRSDVLYKVEEIIDQVIVDNEDKVS